MPYTVTYYAWQAAQIADSMRVFAGAIRPLAVAMKEIVPIIREMSIAMRRWQLGICLVRLVGNEQIACWVADRTPAWVLWRLPLQGFEERCLPGVS